MGTFLKIELGEPRILVVLMISLLKTLCTPPDLKMSLIFCYFNYIGLHKVSHIPRALKIFVVLYFYLIMAFTWLGVARFSSITSTAKVVKEIF
jgi:hypothetical protein